ncbi:hypothetical protein UYO_2977 [Lachnospiraceae bacterium JC7]|nr:hypothetical protein UYO_2977 [Lachnospiraceae bacterium JC7]
MLDKITDSKAHNINDLSGEERDKVAARVMSIIPKLEKIQSGEIRLESKINEKWSDWYNRDAEELLFSDPDKLIKDIQEAIRLLHKCVNHELLDPGSRLCELLCNMCIFSDGYYVDHSEITLSVKDLYERGLLSGGFDVFAKDALFLTYLGNHSDERAEKLYDLFMRFDENICLKDILQMGKDELPEYDDFLKHLIEYVGRKVRRPGFEAVGGSPVYDPG